MPFGHEQLDVYRISIPYVPRVYQVANSLKGSDRPARDQLLRASQSISLNIAEGNGKGTNADRRRCLEIARGAALECASIQNCPEACDELAAVQNAQSKAMLTRIVSSIQYEPEIMNVRPSRVGASGKKVHWHGRPREQGA
jgi:four helix bundle protein